VHEIAQHGVEAGEATLIALRLPGLIDAPERAPRERARFGRTRSGAEVLVGEELEMGVKLALEIALGRSAAEIPEDSRCQLSHSTHG
jgi:hypothetical protein